MVRKISSLNVMNLLKKNVDLFFFFTGKTESLKPYFTKKS